MLRRLPALCLLALVLALPASGQDGRPYESRFDIPSRPSPPRLVNDYTGTLGPAERDALERKLVAFDDSTGSQIAVVIVRTTDGVAPVDYATEILREWGVGRADIDDGVVVLVATEDREVFITTGLGSEGALTDATAGTIVRSILVPNFRQGAFYAGLDGATTAIMDALSGEFEAPSAAPASGGGGEIGSVLCLLLVIFIVLVVLSSRSQPPPSSGGGSRRGGRRRGPGVIVIPSFGGGGGGFGGGGFGGGGFGGGGFGGFGGGFGGGGGAGGSW